MWICYWINPGADTTVVSLSVHVASHRRPFLASVGDGHCLDCTDTRALPHHRIGAHGESKTGLPIQMEQNSPHLCKRFLSVSVSRPLCFKAFQVSPKRTTDLETRAYVLTETIRNHLFLFWSFWAIALDCFGQERMFSWDPGPCLAVPMRAGHHRWEERSWSFLQHCWSWLWSSWPTEVTQRSQQRSSPLSGAAPVKMLLLHWSGDMSHHLSWSNCNIP